MTHKKICCVFRVSCYSFNMQITEDQLNETLITARVALSHEIANLTKQRNGLFGKYFRASAREKIAALRVLRNLATINAQLYTHNPCTVAKLKKTLAN